jgi:hypothetical protein
MSNTSFEKRVFRNGSQIGKGNGGGKEAKKRWKIFLRGKDIEILKGQLRIVQRVLSCHFCKICMKWVLSF